MSDTMAELIAKKFIQRRDVKASQSASGAYYPVTNGDKDNPLRLPFTMSDLRAHLAREKTFGHYLLDTEDKCKLFAFDIDLNENRPANPAEPNGFIGQWCEIPTVDQLPDGITEEQYQAMIQVHEFDAREAWGIRSHPSRTWTKTQLRMLVEKLSSTIKEEFDLPVVSAYSGGKGVHVYGFTGPVPAVEARQCAELVLQLAGGFELKRGKNFFQTIDQSPVTGFPNISIEIFPKQTSISDKDLGNLMRLPLGRNMKSNDPTFFIDQRLPLSQIAPHPDPIALLESGNPWA